MLGEIEKIGETKTSRIYSRTRIFWRPPSASSESRHGLLNQRGSVETPPSPDRPLGPFLRHNGSTTLLSPRGLLNQRGSVGIPPAPGLITSGLKLKA